MQTKNTAMSGKQLRYDYDDYYDSDDYYDDSDSNYYSYNPPSKGVIQPTTRYAVVDRGEGKQISSYEQSWMSHDRNKKTGTYTTKSQKEVASHGESFKERSTGRVGSKDEFKTTSTYRVGDRSGYTEYQYQERYRRVDFGSNGGGGSSSKGGYSNYSTGKKYLK